MTTRNWYDTRIAKRLGLGNEPRRAAHEQDQAARQRDLAGRDEARMRGLRESSSAGDGARSHGAPDPFAVRRVPVPARADRAAANQRHVRDQVAERDPSLARALGALFERADVAEREPRQQRGRAGR